MSAYKQIHDHFSHISQFNHVQAIVGWDEATMMPAGGGEARGQALATLNVLVHELETDPKLPDLIAQALDDSSLNEWQRANLLIIQRRYQRSSCT